MDFYWETNFFIKKSGAEGFNLHFFWVGGEKKKKPGWGKNGFDPSLNAKPRGGRRERTERIKEDKHFFQSGNLD